MSAGKPNAEDYDYLLQLDDRKLVPSNAGVANGGQQIMGSNGGCTACPQKDAEIRRLRTELESEREISMGFARKADDLLNKQLPARDAALEQAEARQAAMRDVLEKMQARVVEARAESVRQAQSGSERGESVACVREGAFELCVHELETALSATASREHQERVEGARTSLQSIIGMTDPMSGATKLDIRRIAERALAALQVKK